MFLLFHHTLALLLLPKTSRKLHVLVFVLHQEVRYITITNSEVSASQFFFFFFLSSRQHALTLGLSNARKRITPGYVVY